MQKERPNSYTDSDILDLRCTRSTWLLMLFILVMIGMPLEFVSTDNYLAQAYGIVARMTGLLTFAYIFVQSHAIRVRPPTKEKAAIKDQNFSQWPQWLLGTLVIVKALLYVTVFGKYYPWDWFSVEQIIIAATVYVAIRFDVVDLQWFAYRIARLTDELSSDRPT